MNFLFIIDQANCPKGFEPLEISHHNINKRIIILNMMHNKIIGVHLVGSIPLNNTGEVLSKVSEILGGKVKRIPDGETGERTNWTAWQLPLLKKTEGLEPDLAELSKEHKISAVDDREFKFLRFSDGFDPRELKVNPRYSEVAITSYKEFARLKQDNTIAQNVRFQISLPTPFSVASLYIAENSRKDFIGVYKTAMLNELDKIFSVIPETEAAIQWDVCLEVIAWEGRVASPVEDLEAYTAEMTANLCNAVPPDAEVGIHLCYGDPGHKHIVEPEDAAILMRMANDISSYIYRPLNWIHMPVPRERHDDGYFQPLRKLALQNDTELYLGLLHYTDSDDGARRRIATAKKYVAEFGIATECGFGRRPVETVIPLLELHARSCD